MRNLSSSPEDTTAAATARRLELEVEPLSEQRWAKIEQAVFARLEAGADPLSEPARPRRAGRVLVWAAAAAALGALLLALVVVKGGASPGEAAALSRISTGATASHLALPGVSLDVSPESTIVVSGGERERMLVVLDRGEVACDVEPRRPGAPLVVQAGEVRVEVVGTRFRVTRQGESARVEVQEGVVRVSSRGQSVAVAADQSWPAPEPTREPSGPPEPVADAPPPTSDQVEVRPRNPRIAPRPTPVEPSIEKPATPEPLSAQQQFETATRLERSEPARAIQLYSGLESGSSSWAANALFAHGRLEAARGNPAAARRILSQYLARFPQGGNAQDARMLLGRLK